MAREVVFLVFSLCLMTVFLRGAMGWSAVCDCGNFWSYSLTFYMIDNLCGISSGSSLYAYVTIINAGFLHKLCCFVALYLLHLLGKG